MASKQYQFTACDPQGQTHTGTLSAENQQEVLAILQTRKLIPISVAEGKAANKSGGRSGINNRDLIDFTEGLCTLVESYVPLDKSLLLLEGTTKKEAMQNLIIDLRREIKEGSSLADALRNHENVFSRMYINMVHAGEEGGILDKLLPRLSKFLAEADQARRTIISALIYPMILAVVGVLSVVGLLVFVVPQFAGLFEDMGNAIPDSAAFLLATSRALQSHGWMLLGLPFLFWYFWRFLDSTEERRLGRDQFLLGVPLLGNLLLEAETSRFCRTLGALLSSGIPLLRGLHIAKGVMENQVLTEELAKVEEDVRQGVSLGKALTDMGKFPIMVPQLVIVGEESGRTAEILEKLAESFDDHVREQTGRMVALVEPLLIVVLGGVVGSVVVVMFSAIFSINDIGF